MFLSNITLKKHNSITDGITDFSLPAEKLLNAVYHTWQEKGVDTFTVAIADLKALINYDSNNDEAFLEYLKELQTLQQFRNFDYKGRQVKYISSSFLMSVVIWKDNQNFADVIINPIIVEALKQKAGYTPIELHIADKFKTIYGYKLWQMWRRYFYVPNKTHSKIGSYKLTLDELNEKLSTDFKFFSKAEEAVKRGVNEINAILTKLGIEEELNLVIPTKEDLKKQKEDKHFQFHWKRKAPYLQTEPIFMEYIRTNYQNEPLFKDEKGVIAVAKNGKLYYKDIVNMPELDGKTATKMWKYFYRLASEDKFYILKQQKFEGME